VKVAVDDARAGKLRQQAEHGLAPEREGVDLAGAEGGERLVEARHAASFCLRQRAARAAQRRGAFDAEHPHPFRVDIVDRFHAGIGAHQVCADPERVIGAEIDLLLALGVDRRKGQRPSAAIGGLDDLAGTRELDQLQGQTEPLGHRPGDVDGDAARLAGRSIAGRPHRRAGRADGDGDLERPARSELGAGGLGEGLGRSGGHQFHPRRIRRAQAGDSTRHGLPVRHATMLSTVSA
jgi:hypothetical protein